MGSLYTIYVIAKNTFVETVRHPVHLILTSTVLVLIALIPFVANFAFGEEGRLARDSGFALIYLALIVCSSLQSSHSIKRDIKKGVASVILAKPVSKTSFFAGKFTGHAACLLLLTLTASSAVYFSAVLAPLLYKHGMHWGFLAVIPGCILFAYCAGAAADYFFNKTFTSSAVWILFTSLVVTFTLVFLHDLSAGLERAAQLGPILSQGVLITLSAFIIAGLSTALSIYVHTTGVIAGMLLIFLGGLMNEYFFASSPGFIPALLHALIPNWQVFWIQDLLMDETFPNWRYIGWSALYTAGYCSTLLSFVSLLMTRKEIANRG